MTNALPWESAPAAAPAAQETPPVAPFQLAPTEPAPSPAPQAAPVTEPTQPSPAAVEPAAVADTPAAPVEDKPATRRRGPNKKTAATAATPATDSSVADTGKAMLESLTGKKAALDAAAADALRRRDEATAAAAAAENERIDAESKAAGVSTAIEQFKTILSASSEWD